MYKGRRVWIFTYAESDQTKRIQGQPKKLVLKVDNGTFSSYYVEQGKHDFHFVSKHDANVVFKVLHMERKENIASKYGSIFDVSIYL